MDQDVVHQTITATQPAAPRRTPWRRLIAAALAGLLIVGVAAAYLLTRHHSSVVTTSSEKQHAAVELARTLVPEVAHSTDAQLRQVGASDCKVLAPVKAGDKSVWAAMVKGNVATAGLTQFHAAQLIDVMVRGFCPEQASKIVDTFSP